MTVALLHKRRAVIIADLLCKVEAEDWHGVADAACDLREIEAMLKILARKTDELLYTSVPTT